MKGGKWLYRMISDSGDYDTQSMTMQRLIKQASSKHGLFHLYQWNGTSWIKIETFIF